MKKIINVYSVLATFVGIGGAYASQQSTKNAQLFTVYNWYTVYGQYRLTGTTVTARIAECPIEGSFVCLKGTRFGYPRATMGRPF
ncbi:hypothetical protein HF329_05675 [Chitinophaga oryzae]|uniref:Uncharacterized protein n=1 Tax=Chitinophaga oryzae TaxID=2725414 RepID=A0AAE6ZEN5_9BACT|nr:hypothetical protein [Chitinophaga oryzae]QJB30815.1 hypothetical protein HF329_05675 [Chitinophaga oryzae]